MGDNKGNQRYNQFFQNFNKYDSFNEDEDNDDDDDGDSMTNSEFKKKLKGNKRLEASYMLRTGLEKIFKKQKATNFYKMLGLYGRLMFTKKTMMLFCKIFKQMKRQRFKVGMVKMKRVWYFGRIHDKEMLRSQRVMARRPHDSPEKQLYHHRKEKSMRQFRINF